MTEVVFSLNIINTRCATKGEKGWGINPIPCTLYPILYSLIKDQLHDIDIQQLSEFLAHLFHRPHVLKS
jgi:hypothetical protein